ncbi:hypothetical protein [Burkholderia cenocepacia]|uniref:hypothetical protein n=1 Tax=Burkholderia cenocepacia TaxID=95486 RepID=UPI002DDD3772|nr:hypothetical protein [Burkholderia cenocepacia]MEC4769854.1 hypothetical protein [Burkholderia cenocepacia]
MVERRVIGRKPVPDGLIERREQFSDLPTRGAKRVEIPTGKPRMAKTAARGVWRAPQGGVCRLVLTDDIKWRAGIIGQLFMPATTVLTLELRRWHREMHRKFAGLSSEAAAAPALPQPAGLSNLRFILQAHSRTTDECNKPATQ